MRFMIILFLLLIQIIRYGKEIYVFCWERGDGKQLVSHESFVQGQKWSRYWFFGGIVGLVKNIYEFNLISCFKCCRSLFCVFWMLALWCRMLGFGHSAAIESSIIDFAGFLAWPKSSWSICLVKCFRGIFGEICFRQIVRDRWSNFVFWYGLVVFFKVCLKIKHAVKYSTIRVEVTSL